MNKLVRGKTSLLIVSIAMIVLSLLCAAGSVGLVVWGAKIVKDAVAIGVILIVAGSALALMFLSGIIYGFVLYFTGKSLVALNGSVAEENLGKGTVNMVKCPNCGVELGGADKFCEKCGKDLAKVKKCPKCGKEVSVDALVCSECGEKLK